MKDLMFAKVYATKKKKKSVNRVKKTSLAKMKREADKLAGIKCRSVGSCDACRSHDNLQWAHMISRRYHVIRWNPLNWFCLCSQCHARFTYNPHMWTKWLMDNHQERFSAMNLLTIGHTKIDREFMEKVLKELNGN